MDWTERDGRWVSGPYTIELLAPEMWALSLRSDDSHASQVEVERWSTGRSLKHMKQMAESMEADRSRVRVRNRQLSIAFGALLVLVAAAAWTGPLAFALAIAASVAVMYSLARAVDHLLPRRPWDNVPETYQ